MSPTLSHESLFEEEPSETITVTISSFEGDNHSTNADDDQSKFKE